MSIMQEIVLIMPNEKVVVSSSLLCQIFNGIKIEPGKIRKKSFPQSKESNIQIYTDAKIFAALIAHKAHSFLHKEE